MSVHAGIIDRLKTDAAVAAALFNVSEGRVAIFPESAPSNQSAPYCVVSVDGDTRWRSSSRSYNTKEADCSVDIVADSLEQLDPISRAVEARLPLFAPESRRGCTLHGLALDDSMTTDVIYRGAGQEKHLLLRSIPVRAYYSDE